MSRSFLPLWFALAIGLVAIVSSLPEEAQDTWRMHIPVESEQREQVLESLRVEFSSPGESRWTILEGCPRVPSYPAAMAAAGQHLYVATEARLERYDLATGSWSAEPLELKEPVGPGVVLLGKGEERLFLLSGGERDSVWEIRPKSGELRALPGLGVPIGRGAALTEWNGELYVNQGQISEDFWVLREGAESWVKLGRIGDESTLDTAFGRNSGFFATLDDAIFAWPNHHIHRFNAKDQTWAHGPEVNRELRHGNWVAMNFLPLYDGGGVATKPGVDSIYSVSGFFSRSLNEIYPGNKSAYFLRPRLPYPIIGEGDRLTIADVDGEPHLFVYAVDPENKLCSIPLSKLERVTPESDAAELDSKWRRFHTAGGGNGVRHWTTRVWKGVPEPMNKSDRKGGSLGVMGPMPGGLFTMRRAYTRRIDLVRNVFSFYPGVNLGEYLGLGAAGAHDGVDHVYFMTGRSDYFLRQEIPKRRPRHKAPAKIPPINETELEVLPSLPAAVGRCGSLAHLDGSLYALRGGETREFWRYDVGAGSWSVLPPLPAEARPIGEAGAGLIAGSDALFAATGKQVWRFGLEEQRWSRLGSLGFEVQWDGGMLAGDGDRHMYVVRGGFSTRLGRVDLKSGVFEELFPRLPDAVSAEGNRMGVVTLEGERRLYLHRGHNSNEILWIRLADLAGE